MSEADFEIAVGEALDLIPAELASLIDNVVVLIEPFPPAETPDLLGLYEGVPLTERGSDWGMGTLPDTITIYRNPLLKLCRDEAHVIDEVRITVLHEVGHFFGLTDERLHELGWA